MQAMPSLPAYTARCVWLHKPRLQSAPLMLPLHNEVREQAGWLQGT